MTGGQLFNDVMWIVGAFGVWRWWRARRRERATPPNDRVSISQTTNEEEPK